MIRLNHIVTLLACVSLACVAEDEIDDDDRDVLIDDDEEEDEDVVNEYSIEPDPAGAAGDPCTTFDSNGPLPGGTITVNGCEAGEQCIPFACGSHSCAGTCAAGGGGGGGKGDALPDSVVRAAGPAQTSSSGCTYEIVDAQNAFCVFSQCPDGCGATDCIFSDYEIHWLYNC